MSDTVAKESQGDLRELLNKIRDGLSGKDVETWKQMEKLLEYYNSLELENFILKTKLDEIEKKINFNLHHFQHNGFDV